ncbi:MAG: flagellar M-ring protein FliF [Candidatus Methylomirabilis oxygeniifera]|uniref:Flagellar M-ring protein n=1 Tax=Methylomirabilis oxygeniifera TaxID=671143 RepID=D5MGD3_METO1|nr:MAG: flagellar M-ring protein FliF [Candidatus Methylomirabilis oxyfera]CBE68814.1 Flagellar basal body M-ring protein [Candidatus Methylomirabilis oxyfera]
MPDAITKVVELFKQVWGGLGLTGRALTVLVGGGALTALLWMVFSTHRPDMTTLFSQLNPSDAGAIVDELKSGKVSYRVVDGGTRILVPSAVVHEIRLHLATRGLPQGGGVGFEIFDRTTLGTTDFVQRLNYQRALQGELARTIGQLKEVTAARVHLALPQPSVFTEQEKPATASVVLNLRPGARLTPEQVRGIVHLVSSSVEGLNADRITVVDTSGKLIARPAEGRLGAGSTGQFEAQEAVEGELERRVRTMLEEILGPNKATVRVAAQMDFTSVERTEERFDPRGVIKSEQRTTETQQSVTASPAAVAGVASNVPDQTATPSQSGQSTAKSTKEAETVQYDVSKVLERKVFSPGELKRVSVAVMVDGTYKPVPDGKGGERKEYVPRKSDELEKIKVAVKNAVGFSAARGDEVEVVEFPFDTSATEKERALMEEAERKAFWYSLVKPVLMGVGVLLVLVFGLRPLIRSLKERRLPTFDTPGMLSMSQPGPTAIETGPDQAPALDVASDDPLRTGLMELARNNPNVVAQLVRAWMVKRPS